MIGSVTLSYTNLKQEIEIAKTNLKKLNYLFENYHLGMNVFRTAKGGRETIKE